MKLLVGTPFLFLLGLLIKSFHATHFRGATISWKPDKVVPGKVTFSFKISWSRSRVGCDDNTIASNYLIGDEDFWKCQSTSSCCTNVDLHSTQIYCTGFSRTEDWTQGENSFERNFTENCQFVVSFTGQNWISNLVVGRDSTWKVPTTVDLRARKDTGEINSSPISASSPIIRLQRGCSYSLFIPANDPDGDTVKCRWATDTGPVDECGGICGSLSWAVLNEHPCTIHLNATISGWHAVALMLEDFPDPRVSASPFSAVPLQFLLKIEDTGATCKRDLRYAPSTLDNDECVTVEPGTTFKTKIAVVENVTRLQEVYLVAPRGVSQTAILGTYPNTYTEVSWTPLSDQYGPHVFCFSAIDNMGNALKQRCVTVLAGAWPPRRVSGTEVPRNGSAEVSDFTRKFTIAFDQEIRRPALPKFIKILSVNGSIINLLASLDTSSSPAVLIKNRTLTFFLPSAGTLLPNTSHFVSIDRGAVVGLQACGSSGSPFEGIIGQTTWSIKTGAFGKHPCEIDGKGPCQKYCEVKGRSYKCYCNNDEILAPNKHTCFSKDQPPVCLYNCSGNGVCIGKELCDCRINYQGSICSEAVCYGLGQCSGHGDCLSPNVCGCRPGWGGRACSVDLCSIHNSCSTCTAVIGCGWCDSSHRCIPGSGLGPDDAPSSCPSWFYYNCLAASYSPTPGCSSEIKKIDCSEPCFTSSAPLTRGPGSLQYCLNIEKACKDFSECFVTSSKACLSWNETACPCGRPLFASNLPVRRRRETSPKPSVQEKIYNSKAVYGNKDVDTLAPKAHGREVVEKTLKDIESKKIFPEDHDLMRRIAYVESNFGETPDTFRKPSDPAGVGIWQMDKGTFDDLIKRSFKNGSLKTHFDSINAAFGIDMRQQTRKDLDKPLISALFARCLLATFKDPIKDDIDSQAKYWAKYYNGNKKIPLEERIEIFKKRVRAMLSKYGKPLYGNKNKNCENGNGENKEVCLCTVKYKGEKCDQPKCPGNPTCSGNGKCTPATDNSGNHTCQCDGRWLKPSCKTMPPAPISGDPHLQTIDGFEFDYFDIGVHWGCISKENEFAVQLAFFQHQGTSLVGGVALKDGRGVITIVSDKTSSSFSLLRINGTQMDVQPGDMLELSRGDLTLYITNDTGFVIYFFQYKNGITYSVETHYSSVLKRQYLNVALGASFVLLKKTSGLCGIMDGNTNNDMTGPDGTNYASPVDFGDSWRVAQNSSHLAGVIWSWNASNFYPSDISGLEYHNPSHVPRYGLAGFNLSDIQNAQTTCQTKGLTGTFLESCKLDILITKDSSFTNQSAFEIGNCPNDCSNNGVCENGLCICSGLWTGEDCSQDGCSDCGPHSECKNGFCECKFGYQQTDDNCTKVSCDAVNNCTSPLNGVCNGTNECACSPGFTGPDCSQVTACNVSCSGHGVCGKDNQCICDPNWSGVDCSVPDCSDLQKCSEQGMCNANASCDCNPGWTGSSCSAPSCSTADDCSGNGLCVSPGQCSCDPGYAFPNCSEPIYCSSVSNCSGNGICLTTSLCLCYGGFTGPSCEYPLCPSGCSNQGICVEANFCECNQGWTGLSCNEPSCESLNFCSGNGKCADFDLCECNSNWTGPDCDVPFCLASNDSSQCSGRGTCVGPGTCDCKSDYAGNLCQGIDVNKCTLFSLCHQICNDTNGRIECGCLIGFKLDVDNATCLAETECHLSSCSQGCAVINETNTCFCLLGYQLHLDGKNCIDFDECVASRHNCDQLCINTEGSFVCSCMEGYTLNADGRTCVDFDECKAARDNCDELCINTEGSFACNCSKGYTLNADGLTCNDFDECKAPDDNCSQLCINTRGSFVCNCTKGFALNADGHTCKDFDECMASQDNCNQLCVNTEGSFVCNCTKGYSLNADGYACDDVDECSSNLPCFPGQICTNVAGSFSCGCPEGTVLLNQSCQAVTQQPTNATKSTASTTSHIPTASTGLTTGELVGIILGTVVGVVLIVIVSIVILWIVKSRRTGSFKLNKKSTFNLTVLNRPPSSDEK